MRTSAAATRSGPLPTTAHERRGGATAEATLANFWPFGQDPFHQGGEPAEGDQDLVGPTRRSPCPPAAANPQARRWPAVT